MVLIPQFVHITRNAVTEEFSKDYVLASKLDGAGSFRILTYSIFPNIIEKIILDFIVQIEYREGEIVKASNKFKDSS